MKRGIRDGWGEGVHKGEAESGPELFEPATAEGRKTKTVQVFSSNILKQGGGGCLTWTCEAYLSRKCRT